MYRAKYALLYEILDCTMEKAMPVRAVKDEVKSASSPSNYKGFVAGVFSGIAKLSVGVRMIVPGDSIDRLTEIASIRYCR